MLMQRVAFLLAVAHAAARPAGPEHCSRKGARPCRGSGKAALDGQAQVPAGLARFKLKFLRDDWQGGSPAARRRVEPHDVNARGARRGLRGRRAPRRRQGRARAAAGRLVSHREAQDPAERHHQGAAGRRVVRVVYHNLRVVGGRLGGGRVAARGDEPDLDAHARGGRAGLVRVFRQAALGAAWLRLSGHVAARVQADAVIGRGARSARLLRARARRRRRIYLPWVPQLAAYCLHLALGDAWNKVFFGQQKVAAGALMITVFYGALLASAYLFSLVDPMAGLLMVPTCVEINQ